MGMIISSERKYNTCPACGGNGKIVKSSALPWMPDDEGMCSKCNGTGKIESARDDYDKHIFNIDTIVTLSEITVGRDAYSGISEYYIPYAEFYINGHILIRESDDYPPMGEKSMVDNKDAKTAEGMQEDLYKKVKAIRDRLIKGLRGKK